MTSCPEAKEVRQMPESKTDICVLCGKDTGIPRDTPIARRRGYIRGCGQLCERCFGGLYMSLEANGAAGMNDEQMNELLALSLEKDGE